MDEAKEKGDSVSIVSESSVTVSETVVETMACEDQIRIEEGGEAGRDNGDEVTVEVLDSHVHIDGGDGETVQASSIGEAVRGHEESNKVGLEGNLRTLDSDCHAVDGLGSRNEVLGGEARAQNEVNGGVARSCSNDIVCGRDESDEVGLEGNPSTLDSEGDLAGDLGSRYEVSGGEAKARNEVNGARVLGFSAPGSSAGKNTDQSSGIDEGGGDLNQDTEIGRVGNLDGNEVNHENQKPVLCLSAASEDSGIQNKIVEEAAMAIDEEYLNALDGAHETISEPIKKAPNDNVDAISLNVNTLDTAECVPTSEAKDPVYSCQSTESIVEGRLDEKVSSDMEIDKQGTESEKQQMEVNTPHLSTKNHDTGNVQCLKPEPVIDGGEGVDLSIGEAMFAEKQVSYAKDVGFDAEQDVEVEKMGVSPKNCDASDVSEPLGHQMDVFVGSGEGEVPKVDNNVLNQISPAVASDKELQSSGNDDPLAKNVVFEDDSSVGKEMNVEDQVTSDEPDCLEQVEEMEVVEHDSDSDQPTNIDELTVKQTALKSVSGLKVHQAKYQQLRSEEGGFSVSDLVWGKIKSHPWWPGQIFDPSDASEKAMKYQKKDSFLVAYFGDRTFAWNESSVLKPFRTHFSQIVKQSNLESFENAVNCALEEFSRRVELGLACPCMPKDAYDKIKFQKVENAGVREESSLRDGIDVSLSASSFEPDKLIDYMKALAESPSSGADQLDLVIAKAQLLAFHRLKGYHQLPESQFSEEKTLEVVECATPMDMDGEQKSEASKTRRSYLKRKHNLKDGLYPSKKERSLSKLMSETFDSPDGEIVSDVIGNKPPSSSFSKKRKAIDSSEDSVMQEGRKTTKGSLSTPHFPKPSFKIGERISRAASQMTGSPSILKSGGDRLHKLDGGCETSATCGYDVPVDNHEDAERKRTDILTEYSSLDDLLVQLHLAACDPMKSYSSLNIIISFFSDFRDSTVLDRLSGDKAVGKRKKSPNSIIGSSETFEFEDMSDTYWTDRIVQNGSEEQPSLGTSRGQYQFVPVELDKPIQKVRKSRKRYSDTSYDLTAQKPPGYVDERAPAEIVMSFPEINSVPSETKLNKMFKHFGPLKESETEVDRETRRARVVFRRSSDAEIAYNSAGKFNIFGPVPVTYQLNYTISESFKASLYAPTLAEENPFIASAPCGDHALIAPSLGEEASFMVSTLGEETLPITTSFHEEPWFIASTTGEDTKAIPTTLADGTLVVATTMYEKTLPVSMTAGVETMAVAANVGEQSLPVFAIINEQMSTAPASLVEEASLSHLTSSKETSTMTTTLHDQTSSIATFDPEIPSVPATVGEEICTIPAPSGFFSDFRDSTVLDRLSGDKAVGKRKKSPNSIIGSSETFEFEDMSDTYWTDRIVQNGSEEQPSLGTSRGQYQFVPVELDKPIQKVRKSRKRYSDTSYDLTAQKPPGYVDERAPAEIVMSFPEINSVPSETKLNKMFKHFGPLKESETEVDRETRRARVVFRRSSDAEIAYNSAGKFNIFGPVPVTYQLNYTISESFKASLYAPTLAEENPFIASAPCGDHALIAPSLGEEASFMVSTLGEETLPITTSFHEEPWFIASTTGEDTKAIPTTLADGTLVVATTMYEKTLPVSMTAGVETMAVIANVGEQSLPVFTIINEQTSTASASLVEEASLSHLTSIKETSTMTTTLHDQTSSIATFDPEIPSVPATVGEEICTIPAPSGEETCSIPPKLDEETTIRPMTLAEENPSIPRTLGEDAPSVPAAFSEEAPAVTLTFSEGTHTLPGTLDCETKTVLTTVYEETTIPATLGQETPTFPATLGEETCSTPSTSSEANRSIPSNLDEETRTNPVTLAEETPSTLETLGEESPSVPLTFSEETPAILPSFSKETPTIPHPFSEGTPTVPVTSGPETQTISTTMGEETTTIPANLGEETTATETLHEETLAVRTTLAEDNPTITAKLDEETPMNPKTLDEETKTSSTNSAEETSTTPTTSDVETSTIPLMLGRDTIPTTVCEETTIPATLGQETSTLPATLGEGTLSFPSTSSEENHSIPTNLDEETPTDPVTLAEERPSIPETLGEETPTVPLTFSEETPAIPPSFSEGTTIPPSFNEGSPVPVALGPETQTIPTTTGEDTANIPATLGEETTSAPVTLHEETLAIPTTLAENSPTMTTKLDEETPTSPTNLAEETLTTPTTSGVEASTVLITNSEETSVVSTTTEMETLPPAGAKRENTSGGSDTGAIEESKQVVDGSSGATRVLCSDSFFGRIMQY
ncbi:hypothetical protein GOBAR_AA00541 [Gossypium barbadense]|uniref:PWWP domain-containing protein n=1 Tax=Gossypium barbadense TaxID=3634 RepID=A0A2P5YWP4_GOSBA|nr:hypothetical protein GOBAR_AA00541 [Gossypium barbadense]